MTEEKSGGRLDVSSIPQPSRARSASVEGVCADDVTGLAAEMSYYFVLSVFPFLIFLAALVGTLPFTGAWNGVLTWVILYFPQQSQAMVFANRPQPHSGPNRLPFPRVIRDHVGRLQRAAESDGGTERGLWRQRDPELPKAPGPRLPDGIRPCSTGIINIRASDRRELA